MRPRTTVQISDEMSAQNLNTYLSAGWYVEEITENNLGFLIFPRDREKDGGPVDGGIIKPFDPNTLNGRVIVVVLTKGNHRDRQQILLSGIPEGGTLDTEFVAQRARAHFPGWSVALSVRLNPRTVVSLVTRAI